MIDCASQLYKPSSSVLSLSIVMSCETVMLSRSCIVQYVMLGFTTFLSCLTTVLSVLLEVALSVALSLTTSPLTSTDLRKRGKHRLFKGIVHAKKENFVINLSPSCCSTTQMRIFLMKSEFSVFH